MDLLYAWAFDKSYIAATHTITYTINIPAKPLPNHDIVSVHFNHFPCMGICNKLTRH